MSLSRRRFITITAGLAASSAVPAAYAAQPVTWRGVALGAEARLIIAGLPQADARQLIRRARDEISRLETIFSLYRSDSELSRLNSAGVLNSPAPELLSMFSTVSGIHKATGGLFDPTVQPLWSVYAEQRGVPSDTDIGRALGHVGWQRVGYDSASVRFTEPGMQLTLNGIAQGFVTDRICAVLRAEGLEDAMVNIGEISALGHQADGQSWPVGLAVHGDDVPEETIHISDMGLATSASSGTVFHDGSAHILNPLTGLPVDAVWTRVSVLHPSATIADGLSTAAVMMNENEMRALGQSVPGIRIIARHRDGQSVVIES
tara:strand:- start:43 stop:996 length:954 start_codon:yes stop_codon:yes gene_type:complete